MFARTMLLTALLLMMVVAVQADGHCDDAIGCVVLAPDDPVTIGVMSALSGPVAFLGEDSVGGVEIALNRRDGTSLGREIGFPRRDA